MMTEREMASKIQMLESKVSKLQNQVFVINSRGTSDMRITALEAKVTEVEGAVATLVKPGTGGGALP